MLSVAASLVLATGCATAGGSGTDDDDDDDIVFPDGGGRPDARPPGTPDARPPGTPDAMPGTPVSITLSQSTATTITAGNSVACVTQDSITMAPLYHSENSFYRVFQLSSFGVTSAFNASKVTIGIEAATADTGGTQPATVKLYTLSGAPAVANLTQIGTATASIADTTTGGLVDVPITGTAPAGSTLVAEFLMPDGEVVAGVSGNLIFPGSNAAGQSGPSYIRAPGCGAADMTDISTLGFPDMHLVLTVTGTHTP